ncbi:MAG TPA: WD40 repeat domain-containing protein, partial [Bacteroidales bacterium]|nr:WD40 repeat domain-containing protein [Bacteroidales bacterium]
MIRFLLLTFILQLVLMPLHSQEVRLGLPVGHTGGITSAKFSPNGKFIVSSSIDNSAILWDSKLGKAIHRFDGHSNGIYTTNFSHDGSYVATASADSTAKVWEVKSGSLYKTLYGHRGEVTCVVFSNDGKSIYTSSTDNNIHIYDLETGALKKQLTGHTDEISTIAISKDNKFMVSASDDYTAKVWDLNTGSIIHSFELDLPVSDVIISPDCKSIATLTKDRSIKIWDVAFGQVIMSLDSHYDFITSVAFSHDSKFLLTSSDDRTINIWNLANGELYRTIEGHQDRVHSASFSYNSELILSSSEDGTVRVWDASNGNLLLNSYIGLVTFASFNPEGKYFLTYSENCNDITVWDTEKGNLICHLVGNTNEVNSASISPNGKEILATYQVKYSLGQNDKMTKRWNLCSGKMRNSMVDVDWGKPLFSPEGSKIISVYHTGTAIIYDALTEEIIVKNHLPEAYSDFIFNSTVLSPDGESILTGFWGNTLRIYETLSGNLELILNGHNSRVNSAAYSQDGKYIISASDDGTAKIWNESSGVILGEIKCKGQMYHAIFSPNNQRIITSSGYDGLKSWTLNGEQYLNNWTISGVQIPFIVFDQNGENLIYPLGNNAEVRSVSNGELLYTLNGHTDAVKSVEFVRDEKRAITASLDGTIIIWNLESKTPIARFIAFNEDGWLAVTNDNYYFGLKKTIEKLYWIVDNTKIYPFEQFDLKYNRPDIVLERLGYASLELIDAYYRAYQKRLKKMGFTEEQLSGEFHIPESAIENFEYMPVIEEKDIEIDLNFNDSKYKLDRYNIWINDVPVFGMTGKSLRNENTDTYKTKEHIVLNEGRNKIQVSCLNEKGAESYKETVEITYTPKTSEKHDLYFVAVSVSEYEDAQFNLKYAVKDGRDMVKLFSEN